MRRPSIVAIALSFAASAGAQRLTPHVSDRVLVRLHAPEGAACETSVVGLRGDTLLLNERRPCPARGLLPARPAELSMVARDHGSRGVHVFAGTLLGGALGVALGRHPLAAPHAITGGIALGALFGASIPAGVRWARVPAPPVNVLAPAAARGAD